MVDLDRILTSIDDVVSVLASTGPKRMDWTPEEDNMLVKMVHECGFKWRQMALNFSGRSEDSIRQRYFRLFRTSSGSERRKRDSCEATCGRWPLKDRQLLKQALEECDQVKFNVLCSKYKTLIAVKNQRCRLVFRGFMFQHEESWKKLVKNCGLKYNHKRGGRASKAQ